VTAVSEYDVRLQALNLVPQLTSYHAEGVTQVDGSLLWTLFVEDQDGDTVSAPIGSAASLTLGDLTLSGSLQIGTSASGTILGATIGSAITGNIPGISIDSDARTYSGTPTGSAAMIPNGLVETLDDATNSPHYSSIAVAAAVLPVFSNLPTISGTVGGLLTGTAATVSNAVGSPTWQWLLNLLPIDGETSSTIDGSLYEGTINLVQFAVGTDGTTASVMSADFANGATATLVKREPFSETATNNQIYTTVSSPVLTAAGGGGATEQNKYTISVSGAYQQIHNQTALVAQTVSGKLSTALLYLNSDIGRDQRVEIDMTKFISAASQMENVILWYQDEFNYVMAQRGNSTSFTLVSVNAGVPTNLFGLTGIYNASYSYSVPKMASYTSTYSLRFDLHGGILSVYERADSDPAYTLVQITSANPGTNQAHDNIRLDNFAGVSQGTMAGIRGAGGSCGCDVVRFYKFEDPLFISDYDVTFEDNAPVLALDLLYSTDVTPTGFDIEVADANALVVLPRTAATVGSLSGGTAQITVTDALLNTLAGQDAIVSVWKTGPGVGVNDGGGKLITMPVFQTILPFVQGINEGFATGESLDIYKDLYMSADWRSGLNSSASLPATITWNRYGLPTNLDPSHTDGFTLSLIKKPVAPGRAGDYIFSWPPDKTINGTTAAMAKLSNIDPGSVSPFRMASATFNRSTTPIDTLYWFTGASASFGPDDYITILPKDDPHPERLITDEAAANWAALGSIVRTMTPRQVNAGPYKAITATEHVKWTAAERCLSGIPTVTPFPVECQVSGHNQSGTDMYWNVRDQDDEDTWADEATYTRDNLDPALKVWLEWMNETWNSGFAIHYNSGCFGARLGMAPDTCSSWATRGDELEIYYNSRSGSVTKTVVSVPSGGYLFQVINGVGMAVFQALRDIPVNTDIPQVGDIPSLPSTDWSAPVFSNTQLENASARYRAEMSMRAWKIWDDVFAAGGRDRTIHVFNAFAGSTMQDKSKLILQWVNRDGKTFMDECDHYLIAPYWSHFSTSQNFFQYDGSPVLSPPNPHPWGTTEKQLVATNGQAFQDAFWLVADDSIDEVTLAAASHKHDLGAFLVANGRDRDSVRFGSYECNWTCYAFNWPDPYYEHMDTMYPTIWKSAEMGERAKSYMSKLASRVGGLHIVFDRGALVPTSGSNHTSGAPQHTWATMESEMDNATSGPDINYRFTAFSATKNGDFS
jgi:hypothetical protein